MTKRGQVTINFEPLVKFPAYMIAQNNKPDSDRQGRELAKTHHVIVQNDVDDDLFGEMTLFNIMSTGVFGFDKGSQQFDDYF